MEKTPKIKPRAKWVFVKPSGPESKISKGGLMTPDNVEQERKAIGTVLSVGSEIKDIKKGDRVIFGVYAGEPLNFDGVDYKFLHTDDVIGFLDEK